jgi:DNA-binding transcriptional MerR regulator
MDKESWTLSELAEETGLTARTIRYYIARGLVDGPDVAGRGAVYSRRHVDRLVEIQRLQSEGRMLAEIAAVDVDSVELPVSITFQQYEIAEGVVVNVRADLAPWRVKQIRQALAKCTAELRNITDETSSKDR